MKILHVDSSISGNESITKKISAAIVQRLSSFSKAAHVTYRDLAASPLDYLNLSGSGLAEQAQALQDVHWADVMVIGAPMYNFSIPGQLKSWLDAIVIPGSTFRYSTKGVEGLLGNKHVYIASSRGGIYAQGTPASIMDHQETLLLSALEFLGVRHIEVIRAEGVKIDEAHAQTALASALAEARHLELLPAQV